ncbi:MAG: peptide chain release factor N(5)-glutamine methyltransferase [Thalassotalea sp.]|nr:peptide chain release factor N(5)-glutamine methyltransferase [Thalassotalea sp.]
MSQSSSELSEVNTIEQLFQYGKSCLSSIVDARDAKFDTQVLLTTVLNKSNSYLLTWPEKSVSSDEKLLFIDFLKRRLKGEPVAYITGKREFWSLDFLVAPCTLIPRPDTEILIEAVLENNTGNRVSVLDLGTGTGAIALALASEHASWNIDAVDFNHDAVALAQANAKQLNLEQVSIYQSDWFSNIEQHKTFDVIVSNPPYIAKDDEHLALGDVRFEPLSALVAEDEGYADIKHIVEHARKYLTTAGQLYLEHGFEQHEQVQQILKNSGYQNIKTFNDYGANPRITMGTL